MSYASFIESKSQLDSHYGFEPIWIPDFLFDFQRELVTWALRRGRAALFEDCGLGKTAQQLVWCENVVRKTNRPVLLLTPLAVSAQTIREAEKFGIEAKRTSDGEVYKGINVTNYEKLHKYDPSDFAAVALDESSILKSFDGMTKKAITDFMRRHEYRLLCTATAAPNDYHELGTSSEALGELGFMDMLARFFKNSRNNSALNRAYANAGGGAPQWTFKGHSEKPFWQWVCSWARAVRRPSDLGFDDTRFTLPPILEREHVVSSSKPRDGFLFAMPAVGLAEEREERRRTIKERCEMVAQLVSASDSAVAWCHLNDEGDALTRMIDGAVQVSGRDSDESKEEKFNAFSSGQIRVLVTKPIIGAWGLNWQHCAHMTAFAGHSFEQYYQSIRRFWRFGQTRKVTVDHVLSDGEGRVLSNLQRKAQQSERLFSELAKNMNRAISIQRSNRSFNQEMEVPSWL